MVLQAPLCTYMWTKAVSKSVDLEQGHVETDRMIVERV
jgi:hypothetical protein